LSGSFFSSLSIVSGVMGSSRIRTPTASAIAFARAPSTGIDRSVLSAVFVTVFNLLASRSDLYKPL